jgi:hypothetical protein
MATSSATRTSHLCPLGRSDRITPHPGGAPLSADAATPIPSRGRPAHPETSAADDSQRSGHAAGDSQRLDGESARDFRAFCIYRNLGEERSLQRAWQEFCKRDGKLACRGKQPGEGTKPPGSWTALSTKNRWVERAAAYDERMRKAFNEVSSGLGRLRVGRVVGRSVRADLGRGERAT